MPRTECSQGRCRLLMARGLLVIDRPKVWFIAAETLPFGVHHHCFLP
ncbi:hypothetical protein [Hoylesella saccharolytica]|nr:hypothetical protein [Hoylesella saccharolytica]